MSEADEAIVNKPRSASVKAKIAARKNNARVDPHLDEQFSTGRLLGEWSKVEGGRHLQCVLHVATLPSALSLLYPLLTTVALCCCCPLQPASRPAPDSRVAATATSWRARSLSSTRASSVPSAASNFSAVWGDAHITNPVQYKQEIQPACVCSLLVHDGHGCHGKTVVAQKSPQPRISVTCLGLRVLECFVRLDARNAGVALEIGGRQLVKPA